MSDFRAASRYAKSLLGLSIERKQLEEVLEDMKLVDRTINENKELAAVLRSPIISDYQKLSVIQAIFSKRVSELSRSFFELLTRKGRCGIFHRISKAFQLQYMTLKGIEKVKITTTISLDDTLRRDFKEVITKISDSKPDLIEEVTPEILGGFVLESGDRRLDASVRSKLQKMEKALKSD